MEFAYDTAFLRYLNRFELTGMIRVVCTDLIESVEERCQEVEEHRDSVTVVVVEVNVLNVEAEVKIA